MLASLLLGSLVSADQRFVALQFTGTCTATGDESFTCAAKAPSQIITSLVSIDGGASSTITPKIGAHCQYVTQGTTKSEAFYSITGNVTCGTHLNQVNGFSFDSDAGLITQAGNRSIASDTGSVYAGTGAFEGVSGRYTTMGTYDHTGRGSETSFWFTMDAEN